MLLSQKLLFVLRLLWFVWGQLCWDYWWSDWSLSVGVSSQGVTCVSVALVHFKGSCVEISGGQTDLYQSAFFHRTITLSMARMLCSLPKKCSRQLVSSNTLVQVCINAATGCMCHQRRWYRSALYKCPDRLQGSAYTLVQVGLAPTGYKGQQIQSAGVNGITALTCYRGHQIPWYRWVLHQQVTGVNRYIGIGGSCTDRLQGSTDTLV